MRNCPRLSACWQMYRRWVSSRNKGRQSAKFQTQSRLRLGKITAATFLRQRRMKLLEDCCLDSSSSFCSTNSQISSSMLSSPLKTSSMTERSNASGEERTGKWAREGERLGRLSIYRLEAGCLVGDASEPSFCFLESLTLVGRGSRRLRPITYLVQLCKFSLLRAASLEEVQLAISNRMLRGSCGTRLSKMKIWPFFLLRLSRYLASGISQCEQSMRQLGSFILQLGPDFSPFITLMGSTSNQSSCSASIWMLGSPCCSMSVLTALSQQLIFSQSEKARKAASNCGSTFILRSPPQMERRLKDSNSFLMVLSMKATSSAASFPIRTELQVRLELVPIHRYRRAYFELI